MSHNQSRGDRTESAQYRKTGRSGSFNQQRQSSGGAPTKGGGGGASSALPNPSNRSFNKKYNSNAPGGQRPRSPNVSSEASNPPSAPPAQNGGHQPQPTRRLSDAPVTGVSSSLKPTDQKLTQAVAKPLANVVPAPPPASESKAPTTPAKTPVDESKSFPLQFGSISPVLMNGVQIPARTSSAPPNLDEQKKAQARNESLRPAPAMPIPSIPKQQPPKKVTEIINQHNPGDAQMLSKSKRDAPVSAAPPVIQTQKPPLQQIPGMHMQLQYHQLQFAPQYGGLNPQLQHPTMSIASMPMQMQIPMPIGNPPVQQQMYVHQMHQGPSLNFSSQMGPPQLPHQLNNMGMNMVPQFPPQQQHGKYISPRKTVKITHPDTHEELSFDSSSSTRSHSNVQPQSQPTLFPNHPLKFSPNILPPASSVPLSSSQVPSTSQPPRSYSQVTVKPAVGSHGEKQPLAKSSTSVGKTDSLKSSRLQVEEPVNSERETEDSSSVSLLESKPGLRTQVNMVNIVPNTSVLTDVSARNEVHLCDSTKNETKKLGQQDQVKNKPTPPPSLTSQLAENKAVEAKSTTSLSKLVPEATKGSFSSSVAVPSEVSKLTSRIDASNSSDQENKEAQMSASTKTDTPTLETSVKSLSLGSPETIVEKKENSGQVESSTIASGLLEDDKPHTVEESPTLSSSDVKMAASLEGSSQSGGDNKECSMSSIDVPGHDYEGSKPLSVPDSIGSKETVANSAVEGVDSAPPSCGDDVLNPDNGDHVSGGSTSSVKEALSDSNMSKAAIPRGKKKKKELYRKADATGASSDLYNAYKGPEEKKETVNSVERAETATSISINQTSADVTQGNVIPIEKPDQTKKEPDDWEDVAEISTPQLESLNIGSGSIDGDGNGLLTKRYTRDFLLKFEQQCMDLPDGFEITPEIVPLMGSSPGRGSLPSPGRNNDRNSRPDRHGTGMNDESKWNNMSRADIQVEYGYAANVMGMRNQGVNHGVLRNPRAQTPVQYIGGILSGPMQSLGPQGSLQRNNSDSDRWQRGTGFQKGLMPSPRGPQAVMHRAEKKYEVGKITDEEQAKQRQLKSILNKLTPQNFEKLFQQVKEVNIDNVVTLSGVISQIFDKALMEPTFCEMYADFCFHLAEDLPDLSVENQKITFKRLLLNKCQEEFERGEREEEEANKEEEEGEVKQTPEEREEKRLQARRRMLGNIRLIGELYKKRMLTERIMHECINKLLGQSQNPDEENIEALCKLMSTIGEMIDHIKAKEHMDYYFNIMAQLSNNMRLSSRLRFMLKDSIDLRRNKWQQRRKVEGPKKIEDVHRDAAQERQQAGRMARTPSFGNNNSVRRAPPPMEFSPRGGPPSMLPSPNSGYRAVSSPHMRGFGSQDARAEERHSFENRAMSNVPLTQRPVGDDLIMLGPQGGLAGRMSFRGQPSLPSNQLAGHVRIGGPGFNGEHAAAYGQREDLMPRYPSSVYEQSHPHDHSSTYGNRDSRNIEQGFNRLPPTSPLPQPTQMLEDLLRNKSMATIKEYYSARDEKEVALCIKDLNNPSFHPSVVSIWVSDSFERKDVEREILTQLLINLTKSQNRILSEEQLTRGFESVLSVLEDAVNDAPRAWEFLGRLFARVIMENVVSLSEIGRLIYEGGEEKGMLLESGLAAKVLGSVLEFIQSEKGDAGLNEIRLGSNLRVENFRPQGFSRPLVIDKFI